MIARDEADNDQDNEPEFHPLVGGQDFPFHRGLRVFAGLLFLRPPGLGGFSGSPTGESPPWHPAITTRSLSVLRKRNSRFETDD